MAVIGIGTASRASVEDVLAVIEAATATMAERVAEKAPSPLPLSREGRGEIPLSTVADIGTVLQPARPAPSPHPHSLANAGIPSCKLAEASLRGEGWGEGEQLIAALAALDRPAHNRVLQEAAQRSGLDLILLTLDELRAAAPLCVTHSEHSMKQYGIPSVAEAAALAGAGPGARLLVPRFLGRNTTASVADRL